jgi:hypothetical protein
VLAAIASINVQSLMANRVNPARSPADTDPMVGTEAQRVERAHHAAAVAAALAPAAMTALLDAQESMGGDATALGRACTVRQIDHLITRMTGAPPVAVTTPGADFSLARLMTARQQLRETYA